MSDQLRKRIFAELDAITLVDPHTHINPHAPTAKSLADILCYHYFTELAHSAGMPRTDIEEQGLEPREKVRRLVERLGPLHNTMTYQWLMDLVRAFFDFSDSHITPQNWETLYDNAGKALAQPDWTQKVLHKSKLRAVFLTNDFDDPLEGFDTQVYIPCLRTDDLVFHLGKAEVRERLEKATGTSVTSAATLNSAISALFDHFTSHGARACAISLPPDFSPRKPADDGTVDRAVSRVWTGDKATEEDRAIVSQFVFWTLAQHCAEYRLPFDLMIGVNRAVYTAGVYQGQDLFDSRVSLMQYRELLNAFPQVTFPISVLASVTNQELVSFAWIFPNVVTSGHWWYSNIPSFIERDAAARLDAVPATKQIAYYSDAYKLEFALPKFGMYKQVLAKILSERLVNDRGWSEEDAVALGRQVLRDNVQRVFSIE